MKPHPGCRLRLSGQLHGKGNTLMVRKTNAEPGGPTAGNGILSRRIFLEGALVVGAAGAGPSFASAEPPAGAPLVEGAGGGVFGYRPPSLFLGQGVKSFSAPPAPP